ncbi:MAG: hypothetical protein WD397_14070 [Wenzhouxiangellaceae bacterium]
MASTSASPKICAVARHPEIARRAVFDARIALTLRHHGVTEFATRNTADFEGFGFINLINPIDGTEHEIHDGP